MILMPVLTSSSFRAMAVFLLSGTLSFRYCKNMLPQLELRIRQMPASL